MRLLEPHPYHDGLRIKTRQVPQLDEGHAGTLQVADVALAAFHEPSRLWDGPQGIVGGVGNWQTVVWWTVGVHAPCGVSTQRRAVLDAQPTI